jgi:hypothetical protein
LRVRCEWRDDEHCSSGGRENHILDIHWVSRPFRANLELKGFLAGLPSGFRKQYGPRETLDWKLLRWIREKVNESSFYETI